MYSKFLYLYLAGGVLALGLLIYDICTNYNKPDWGNIALEGLSAILFLYLSYKTYHEKKDGELM